MGVARASWGRWGSSKGMDLGLYLALLPHTTGDLWKVESIAITTLSRSAGGSETRALLWKTYRRSKVRCKPTWKYLLPISAFH